MPFATSPADLPDQDEILTLSGLEFMTRMRDGTLPGPPIARVMGYDLHSVEEGRVVFRGAPGFDVTNPLGTVHGGWYGTLLDSAMACAVMTRVPRGAIYTTLEYKVSLLRAISLDMVIDSIGIVEHAGRSTGVARGEIRGVEDGRLYATGTTTCLIMQLA